MTRARWASHVTKAAAVAAALFCLTACASVRPGTGDVAFRLRWEGEADLDLHVDDPNGSHTGFLVARRGTMPRPSKVRSEGILDIDCNADPEHMCNRPIENVYWPVGKAPAGEYTVWAYLFQAPGASGEVPFTLEILLGDTVIERRQGSLDISQPESHRFRYTFRHEAALRVAGLASP